MGKPHDKLSKLGWDKVHRSFDETENVHVAEGWGEIVGEVEGEVGKFGWDVWGGQNVVK